MSKINYIIIKNLQQRIENKPQPERIFGNTKLENNIHDIKRTSVNHFLMGKEHKIHFSKEDSQMIYKHMKVILSIWGKEKLKPQ